MADLVEQLRARTKETVYGPVHNMLDLLAADEIERLRKALKQICLGDDDDWSVVIARHALEPRNDDFGETP